MSPQEERAPSPETALKRYDIVMRYLATEAQIFWTRSQFFLVANATLIGLVVGQIPISLLHNTSTSKLAVLIVAVAVGESLCVLWFRAIASGNKWLNHWTQILVEWEAEAMGRNLFRVSPRGPSSRSVALWTARLFTLAWSLLGAFGAVCFFLRIKGIELP
jgi:hypothetical protein